MTRTAAILILFVLMLGCQADEALIDAPIEGKWEGTLAEVQLKPFGLPLPINNKQPSFATVVEFQPEGTLVVWDDTTPIKGTFKLSGNALTINTDYTIEDIALSGTYTIETLTEEALIIYLEREDQTIDAEGAPRIKGEIKITLHFVRR